MDWPAELDSINALPHSTTSTGTRWSVIRAISSRVAGTAVTVSSCPLTVIASCTCVAPVPTVMGLPGSAKGTAAKARILRASDWA